MRAATRLEESALHRVAKAIVRTWRIGSSVRLAAVLAIVAKVDTAGDLHRDAVFVHPAILFQV